jgi:hypothetical protein
VSRPPADPARKRSHRTARIAGKTAERLVVAWARSNGAPHAERRVAGARHDRGDIAGTPGLVIEVKAPGPGTPIQLGPWLDETFVERDNDNASVGLLVVKRRNRGSPADWYWICDGITMAKLLRDAGWWQ